MVLCFGRCLSKMSILNKKLFPNLKAVLKILRLSMKLFLNLFLHKKIDTECKLTVFIVRYCVSENCHINVIRCTRAHAAHFVFNTLPGQKKIKKKKTPPNKKVTSSNISLDHPVLWLQHTFCLVLFWWASGMSQDVLPSSAALFFFTKILHWWW